VWYFATAVHEEAAASLRYTVEQRKGCCLVTGAPGTGKTTALRKALAALEGAFVCECVATPNVRPGDLVRTMCAKLSVPVDSGTGPSELLSRMQRCAESMNRRGRRVVLVIEDAHFLRPVVLSAVSTLGALDAGETAGKLVGVLLVGDDRLRETLAAPGMARLRQQLFRACRLKPLSSEQTAAYVQYRLRRAGTKRTDIFGAAALTAVHQLTGGVPRLINHLCDNALISSYADSHKTVKASTLREVAEEVMLLDSREPAADDAGRIAGPAPVEHAPQLDADVVGRLAEGIQQARDVLGRMERASTHAAKTIYGLRTMQKQCAPLLEAKESGMKEVSDKAQRLLATARSIRQTFRHMIKAMRLSRQQIEAMNTATAMGHAKMQEVAEIQRWVERSIASVYEAGMAWQQVDRSILGNQASLPVLAARREKARIALDRCSRVLSLLRSDPELFGDSLDGGMIGARPRSPSSAPSAVVSQAELDSFSARIEAARESLQLETVPTT